MAERTRRTYGGTIRIGDGPEIHATFIGDDSDFQDALERLTDAACRPQGVDPDRVIDGELGQLEIEA